MNVLLTPCEPSHTRSVNDLCYTCSVHMVPEFSLLILFLLTLGACATVTVVVLCVSVCVCVCLLLR